MAVTRRGSAWPGAKPAPSASAICPFSRTSQTRVAERFWRDGRLGNSVSHCRPCGRLFCCCLSCAQTGEGKQGNQRQKNAPPQINKAFAGQGRILWASHQRPQQHSVSHSLKKKTSSLARFCRSSGLKRRMIAHAIGGTKKRCCHFPEKEKTTRRIPSRGSVLLRLRWKNAGHARCADKRLLLGAVFGI